MLKASSEVGGKTNSRNSLLPIRVIQLIKVLGLYLYLNFKLAWDGIKCCEPF